jgi:hypothetical protein
MAANLQVGSKLVELGIALPQVLEENSTKFLDNWRVMMSISRETLFNQVAASGWNIFFIADRLNTVSIGINRDHALQRGVRQLAARVRSESYNCLEVTEIKTRHFMGIPYLYIAADMLHIQQGFMLDALSSRKKSRVANAWARQ